MRIADARDAEKTLIVGSLIERLGSEHFELFDFLSQDFMYSLEYTKT